MDEYEISVLDEVEMETPVLIEGLPGVGHVGKLVAEHLGEEFDSRVVRRIHSHHFPPQCTVGDDGTTELVSAELYEVEADGVPARVSILDEEEEYVLTYGVERPETVADDADGTDTAATPATETPPSTPARSDPCGQGRPAP